METNSKKIMEAMPSFEDFMALAEQIKVLSVSKMKLENQIKEVESSNFKEVMTNEKYFVSNKPVAISFFENAYKFAGIDGNLVNLRNQLADSQAALEMKRHEFEIYKAMHDLFKTLVYQERVLT